VTIAEFAYPVLAFRFSSSKRILIYLSSQSFSRIPDEGYFRNASYALNWISTYIIHTKTVINQISPVPKQYMSIIITDLDDDKIPLKDLFLI